MRHSLAWGTHKAGPTATLSLNCPSACPCSFSGTLIPIMTGTSVGWSLCAWVSPTGPSNRCRCLPWGPNTL